MTGAAAVATGRRRLWLAGRAVRWAADTHVEMIVVAPPRPDLFKPGAVGTCSAAQRHLDRRVDEDALHLGVRGGRLDLGPLLEFGTWPTLAEHRVVWRRPVRIHIAEAARDHAAATDALGRLPRSLP